MRVSYAAAGIAIAVAGFALQATPSISADSPTSAIRGRLQENGIGSDGGALVLVVPADTPQPIGLDLQHGPDLDSFLRIPTERSGPGLVRTGLAYGYGVTDLKPGRYFVGTTADFGPYGAMLPPFEIETLVNGQPSSMYAFEVTLEADSTLMVNFELGSQYPDTPGRFEICASTYDPATFEVGIPDRVTAATVAAVDDEVDTRGSRVTIKDNGCAQFENLPRGDYTYTLTTEHGFTFEGDLTVRGGEDGRIEQVSSYISVDSPVAPALPHAGAREQSGGTTWLLNLEFWLIVFGSLALVCAALTQSRSKT